MLLEGICSLNSKFNSFSDEALNGGPMNEKEKLIASMAACMALGNKDKIRGLVIKAKQNGITNEEISQLYALTLTMFKDQLDFGLTDSCADSSNSTDQSQSNCCV
ncbi:hypothetical protein CHN50_20720 [Priestia aryabhattai]|jgi:alkylhydroperoxidase/carboxymuconolactone decarboxylase family protein YurZ|uniref:carboxymuconolactone decarboxylase family protein n=1 Tax=Bacillaceae TaxID=186817 RepID=UPI000BA0DA52|nr:MULTISPECIES: carboxymuconolactone decarboxylase family protein [Bacillaceae]OZT10687.1 hypothetical protein CHN50_20720 [Priestia aryabhattai]MCA1204147.1 carboxymuconolactone decarboxylase family protein [Priestia flexa]MCG7315469.1 carboxymuconolactone decarboxylase family protein [Priestia flexa]QCS54129.1 hypothetical protein FED53_16770 [Priestia flexa]WHX79802.1 carboxymuconolactone decarboxylase family protein [Priestia flexa]